MKGVAVVRKVVLAATLVLLLSSCVPATNPWLPAELKTAADPRLVGNWRLKKGSLDLNTFDKQLRGNWKMDIQSPFDLRLKLNDDKSLSIHLEFDGIDATTGAKSKPVDIPSFLVRVGDADLLDLPGTEPAPHNCARLIVSGPDEFKLVFSNILFWEDAIKAGTIKGSLSVPTKEGVSKGEPTQITDTTANIFALLSSTPAEKIFNGITFTFERIKTTEPKPAPQNP